jgi:hypothetical protein
VLSVSGGVAELSGKQHPYSLSNRWRAPIDGCVVDMEARGREMANHFANALVDVSGSDREVATLLFTEHMPNVVLAGLIRRIRDRGITVEVSGDRQRFVEDDVAARRRAERIRQRVETSPAPPRLGTNAGRTGSGPNDERAAAERPFNVRAAAPHVRDPEELLLLVDHIPTWEEMRWRERDGSYVAEQDGCVRYLHAGGDGRGFYGAGFELTMEDGTRRTLIGPYSGAADFVNEAFPELGGVVEAAATDTPFDFASGGGGIAIKLTTARLAEIHAQFPELGERQRATIAERHRERAEHNAAIERRRMERALQIGEGGYSSGPPAPGGGGNRPTPGRNP